MSLTEDDDWSDVDQDEDALSEARDALAIGDRDAAIIALRSDLSDDLADRLAGEARSLIEAGLVQEAAARIDLYLRPKFGSIGDCRTRYAKAMGARS